MRPDCPYPKARDSSSSPTSKEKERISKIAAPKAEGDWKTRWKPKECENKRFYIVFIAGVFEGIFTRDFANIIHYKVCGDRGEGEDQNRGGETGDA